MCVLGAGDGVPALYHMPRASGKFLAGQGQPNLGDATLTTPSPHRTHASASPVQPLRLQLPPQDTLDQTQVVESLVEAPKKENKEVHRTGSYETIPDTPVEEYWPDNQLGLLDSQRGGHTPVPTQPSEPGDKSSPQPSEPGSKPASPPEPSEPVSSEKISQSTPTEDNAKKTTASSGSKPAAKTSALQKLPHKGAGTKAVSKPAYMGGFYWKILIRTKKTQCTVHPYFSINTHVNIDIYDKYTCT